MKNLNLVDILPVYYKIGYMEYFFEELKMVKQLKAHEMRVKVALGKENEDIDWTALRQYHNIWISYLQHERLVHLMVTLAFGLFLLISVSVSVITKEPVFMLLDLLFFILLIPYIFHYYKLENGVQRLYLLSDEIEDKLCRKH